MPDEKRKTQPQAQPPAEQATQAEQEAAKAVEAVEEKEEIGEKGVIEAEITEEMQKAYIDYAMSVIVSRALPAVEDGLKPVQRRILYAMHAMGLQHSKPTRKSARIVGECFVKDTLVLTGNGLVQIQNIKEGDNVYTQNVKHKVIQLYEMPKKKLLKIVLENGTQNIATPSQMFKVFNKNFEYKWKKAKDLTENDWIVVRAHYPKINDLVQLPNFEGKRMMLNENIAYLLGQLMSDGWISEDYSKKKLPRVGFCSSSVPVIKRIQNILKKEFGYEAKIEKKKLNAEKGKRVLYIRINRLKINQFIVSTFSLKNILAPTKKIPSQIFTSPKSVIFSFISGLIDGDGSIHKSRNVVNYVSVSEKLIDKLLLITQQLGIIGKKFLLKSQNPHLVNGRIVKSSHPVYYIEFKGEFSKKLARNLNLANEKKRARIERLSSIRTGKSNFEVIPFAGNTIFSELSNKHLGSGWYKDKENKKFRLGIKYPTGCKIRYSKDLKEKELRKSQIIEWNILKKLEKIDSRYLGFLKEVLDNKIFFIKVKKIEESNPEKTYDFQVNGAHEFIANGVVSHNCMGKFHPHGDIAIYDALARMAQDFSLRYPLVQGQGNWGSLDGDRPAASRYTEARLAAISSELLADIDKETVKFVPNYDNSITEPSVLPAKLPALLLNGASGIAVGMTTNLPPHNIVNVIDSITACVDKPNITIEKLARIIQGPDFPTGGYIAREGISELYKGGKAHLTLRGKIAIEKAKGHERIVITEIPYQVNKAGLVIQIAKLIKEKRLQDISGLRDESAKGKIRVVMDLRRGADPKFTINRLYKFTGLQTRFNAIMLALVACQPRILNLKEIVECYIKHRKDVVTKRTRFELQKASERQHITHGLMIALKNIDSLLDLLKRSANTSAALVALQQRFKLSKRQAQAILDTKLQRLTALEQRKLKDENEQLLKKITELQKIVASEKAILGIVRRELQEVKRRYGDSRRTRILERFVELTEKDLVAKRNVVITTTERGYVKRMPIKAYHEQRRGGKGVIGTELATGDFVKELITCSTHDHLLFFTSSGRVYWLKAYQIPKVARYGRGKAIINILNIREPITATFPVKEFKDSLLMATAKGIVKRIKLEAFSRPRKTGVRAINLKEDTLIAVKLVKKDEEIMLATRNGAIIKFSSDEVRAMGRTAYGVTGIKLQNNEVVSLSILPAREEEKKELSILTITKKGYGKRTSVNEYRKTRRAGKGVINIRCTGKTGKVVGTATVTQEDSIIITTAKGMVIRVPVKGIRLMGRATQGVRIIRLREGDEVKDLVKVPKAEPV